MTINRILRGKAGIHWIFFSYIFNSEKAWIMKNRRWPIQIQEIQQRLHRTQAQPYPVQTHYTQASIPSVLPPEHRSTALLKMMKNVLSSKGESEAPSSSFFIFWTPTLKEWSFFQFFYAYEDISHHLKRFGKRVLCISPHSTHLTCWILPFFPPGPPFKEKICGQENLTEKDLLKNCT